MKNSLKIGFLALAIATSFAACKGKGSSGADSSATKTDSSVSTTDTSKKDTTLVKPDTAKKDTAKKK